MVKLDDRWVSVFVVATLALLGCRSSGARDGGSDGGGSGASRDAAATGGGGGGGGGSGGSGGVTIGTGGRAMGTGGAAGAGAGGSGTGGAGGAPLPARIVIATGQRTPSGIAVDETFVYFANRDDGTIVRCPRNGCGAASPAIVASGQDRPLGIATDATHLYWVTGWRDGDTGGPSSRPVFRCQLPACDPTTIAPFDRGPYQPYGISVVADRVYLAAWPSLAACPKTGCSGAAVALGGGPFVSVDADQAWVYGAAFGLMRISRCPLSGCTTEPAFVTNVFPMSVVVDAENLYVADYDFFNWQGLPDGGTRQGRIVRCPLAGCGAAGPTVMESGETSPYAMAEYGDRLYFTNITHGTVVSIRK